MSRPTDTVPAGERPATAGGPHPAADDWIEIRPTTGFLPRLDLRELWDYRDVGLILAQRDLKIRYKQTFFGVAWALIQPLLAMVVFTLIFGEGVGVPSDGVPYAAFALAGLAVWFPFNTALAQAAESLTRNPEMVTKVYFPRLMAPLAAVLAPGVDLAIAMTIAVVVAVIVGVGLPLTALLLPLLAVGALVVAFAMGVWLSALNVLYRDVRYALGFALQLLFFLTPVVYPSSVAGSGWQYVLAANPLVGAIDLVRWAMLGAAAPPAGVLLISAGSAILLAVSGLVFFRRTERHFADRI